LAAFNEIGHPIREHDEPGAWVFLYDYSTLGDDGR